MLAAKQDEGALHLAAPPAAVADVLLLAGRRALPAHAHRDRSRLLADPLRGRARRPRPARLSGFGASGHGSPCPPAADQGRLSRRPRRGPHHADRARAGGRGAPITCSVDLGRAMYEAQAHAGVGGAGTAACSGDLLLGALAACASAHLPDGRHRDGAGGALDRDDGRGRPRPARHARARPRGRCRLSALRLRFAVDAPDASQEYLDALLRKTERYCTVAQTLMAPPALDG